METLGKEFPFYSKVKNWQHSLKGRESVEDDGQSYRPKDAFAYENVKVVHTLIMCDRTRDMQSIASEVGISFWTAHLILTDILGVTKVSARWVQQMLTADQKGIESIFQGISCLAGDFIEQVVTRYETYVHQRDGDFDSESKMQSKHWKHPD